MAMRRTGWLGWMILAAGLAWAAAPAVAQRRGEQTKTQSRTTTKSQTRTPSVQRPAPGGRGHGSAPGVGGGFIPSAPPKRPANARPEPNRAERPGHPAGPHVDATGDVWVGRAAPNDPRYRLARPWQHGHFPGVVGARQIWRLQGGGPGRFWFGGYIFMVAPVDAHWCSNWFWDSDDIVLYLDPDQPGWYIAYNVRLGTWCHVEYLGIL
jgi:hypothetical protein